MTRFAITVGCFVFILLSGCSTTPNSTEASSKLNELLIKNNTSNPVVNVTLQVPKRGSNVSCNFILPGYDCSLGFPAIKFENHLAILSWSQSERTYNKPLPTINHQHTQQNKNIKAVVTILDDGELSFELH